MNATFDEVEKEWKGLEVGDTVGDRTFYEAHFNHLLATKLDASGYGIRRTEHHFELAGVSRELVEKFSRRTKLQEFALQHNCRLIVTGDTKQHHRRGNGVASTQNTK